MAWTDRLREAAYTSPSGTRIVFQYEDVQRGFDKRTAAFDFVDVDGTYVQDSGTSSDKFPLRIFLWGDDYDLEAERFEDLLRERGTGSLEHPIYGTVDVVPFGAVTRNDNLKRAANQAIIEVTFWQTIGLVFPTAQTDPGANVLSQVEAFNTAIAQEFEDGTNLADATTAASFRQQYDDALQSVDEFLAPVASAVDTVQNQFDAINTSINQGIDTLIAQPLDLAFQTVQLIQSPARAIQSIQARLEAYGNLAERIVGGGNSTNETNFRGADLVASGAVSGSIVSSVNNQFETRTQALDTATQLIEQFDTVNTWREENFTAVDVVDTGASYQALQQAVAVAAGFLVEIAFDLQQERRLVLTRNRNMIELCAELYGETDSRLDFFINSNDLSPSEIIELPAGREVVYYV